MLVSENLAERLVGLRFDSGHEGAAIVLGDEEEIDVWLFSAETINGDPSLGFRVPSAQWTDLGTAVENLSNVGLQARGGIDPTSGVFFGAAPFLPMNVTFRRSEAMPFVDGAEHMALLANDAYGGVAHLIEAWQSDPQNRTRRACETMPTLFDGTSGVDDIVEILDRMEANCPQPFSNSRRLWEFRRATHVADHNRSKETMLERGVAMLADNGHMPGWFNQCPAASGIGDSSRDRHRSVDLVHWTDADSRLSLVELKWDSDSPCEAVRQVLRYGAVYLFCRMHWDRLPVEIVRR